MNSLSILPRTVWHGAAAWRVRQCTTSHKDHKVAATMMNNYLGRYWQVVEIHKLIRNDNILTILIAKGVGRRS